MEGGIECGEGRRNCCTIGPVELPEAGAPGPLSRAPYLYRAAASFPGGVLGYSDFWTGEDEADLSPCLLSLCLSHLFKYRNGLRFQTGLGWSFVSRTRRCLESSDHRGTGRATAIFPPAPLPAVPDVRHAEELRSAEQRTQTLLSCDVAVFLLRSASLIQGVFNSAFLATRENQKCAAGSFLCSF